MTTFGNEDDAAAKAARLRAGALSLGVGTTIFGGKLVAWWLTGSTAVLSDALESIINVVAAGGLLYSLVVAARPADESHPYGHGKVEFFSAGVEGACIAGASVAIVWASVRALLRGPHVENIDFGLLVLLVTAAMNLGLGSYLVRVGRREHSLALVADGKHVLTDVTTSAGVLAGLAAVRITGLQVLDPIVAMGVGLNILFTGWRLVREAVGGLMDEADLSRLEPLVAALEAERAPEWIDVHSFRIWRSGHLQHVDMHLTVPRYLDVERGHAIDEKIAALLSRSSGLPTEVIVHFDPCRPRHCPDCRVEGCPVRAAPLGSREPLSLERAIRTGTGKLEPLPEAGTGEVG
jgi:cation diffusion facilitator family transporter